jgi:hypothetical protein
MQTQTPVTVVFDPQNPNAQKVSIEVKVVNQQTANQFANGKNAGANSATLNSSSWRHNVIPETEMFWKPPKDENPEISAVESVGANRR